MKIGDRVVYPMHGAGEITDIEDVDVGGVTQSYYILRLPMGNLKLMLPLEKIDDIGLRDIIDKDQIEKVEETLKGRSDDAVGSWNKRYHATLDRMKSGDILDAASVARNLTRQQDKRKISSGEKRLLDLSRQILISELVYALGKTPEEVSDWVDEHIAQGTIDDEDASIETAD